MVRYRKLFTIGPWHIEQGPLPVDTSGEYWSVLGDESHGFAHATVTSSVKEKGEAEANAKLMAAAPALLEALEELCEIIESEIAEEWISKTLWAAPLERALQARDSAHVHKGAKR